MTNELQQITEIGLEGAGVILIMVICYKLLKMKSSCDSVCFSKEENKVQVHLENPGLENV